MTDKVTPQATAAAGKGPESQDDEPKQNESKSTSDSDVVVVAAAPVEQAELVDGAQAEAIPDGMITSPAKVMRLGSMVKQLLEEVRQTPLDDASRDRLAEVYDRTVVELTEALAPDLQEELRMLHLPFEDGTPATDAELRIAQAQLVGWLEGLFHGIQATLFAQQLAARQQLDQMRQIQQPPPPPPTDPAAGEARTGTYL